MKIWGKGTKQCSSKGWMDSWASLVECGRIQEGKQSHCWSISKKKLATSSEFKQTSSSQSLWSNDAQDKSSQVFCIKHKYQHQKLVFPGACEQGFVPLGYWISLWIDHNSISKGLGIHEVFLFSETWKTDSNIRQPCRQLWLKGPEGLKTSLVCSPPIRTEKIHISVIQCNNIRDKGCSN